MLSLHSVDSIEPDKKQGVLGQTGPCPEDAYGLVPAVSSVCYDCRQNRSDENTKQIVKKNTKKNCSDENTKPGCRKRGLDKIPWESKLEHLLGMTRRKQEALP